MGFLGLMSSPNSWSNVPLSFSFSSYLLALFFSGFFDAFFLVAMSAKLSIFPNKAFGTLSLSSYTFVNT